MANETMLDAALSYAKLGLAMFPLAQKDKVPVTKTGFYKASTDPDAVRTMWGRNRNFNIGASMGEPSGCIAVIDIDVDEEKGHDGFLFFDEWSEEHGPLPETVSARTGRGGLHLFYRVDREIRPSANDLIHIDVRGDGSYVVLPPSIHPDTGRAYEWINSPFDREFAEADASVYALLEAVRKKKKSEAEKVKAPERQTEGGRNDTLFKLACSMQEQGFSDEAIRGAIEAENEEKCKPPLDAGEIVKLLGSALGYPKGAPSARGGGPFDHAAFAKRMIDEKHMRYIDGAPAVWNGRCYEVGRRAVESAMIDLKKTIPDRNRREAMKYLDIKAPRVSMADKRYIAFDNCVLDVLTMETRGMSPELVISNVIPHRWNPDAESRAVDEVLVRLACGDADVMENLIEVIGMCMYRGTEFASCPFLTGGGSNGKSTYINMLHNVVGNENCASMDIATIGERFQTVPLMGKLANLGDDIANGFLDGRKLSVFKKIVTGDYVPAEYKGGDTFAFKPYCTLVFSCNEMPRLGDSSFGMARRLHPVPFNARFSREDPDFNPNIERDLAEESAMERAIVLGVDGLRRCIARNGVSDNDKSRLLLREIELESNNVAMFAVEEFDSDNDPDAVDGLEIAKAYESYREWCDDAGVMRAGRKSFTKKMNEIFGTETWNKKTCGKVVRIFRKSAEKR